MKRNLQKLFLSLGLVIAALVSSPFQVRAQEIIRTTEGDTLITITPPQLRIINCIISDYEFSLKKEAILEKKTLTLEHKITHLDSLVQFHEVREQELQRAYISNIESLKKQMDYEIKKERKAAWIKGGIGGAIVGGLLVLLLTR